MSDVATQLLVIAAILAAGVGVLFAATHRISTSLQLVAARGDELVQIEHERELREISGDDGCRFDPETWRQAWPDDVPWPFADTPAPTGDTP